MSVIPFRLTEIKQNEDINETDQNPGYGVVNQYH